jgi:hypothetical protein
VSARIHALVQHPHDLDPVRTTRAVVDDMDGLADTVLAAQVPDVEAANAG